MRDESMNSKVTNRVFLPETGFLRISQIIGNPRSDPPTPAIIPVSRSQWWLGVKSGLYPKPIKLSPRCTAWRAEDLRAFIKGVQS